MQILGKRSVQSSSITQSASKYMYLRCKIKPFLHRYNYKQHAHSTTTKMVHYPNQKNYPLQNTFSEAVTLSEFHSLKLRTHPQWHSQLRWFFIVFLKLFNCYLSVILKLDKGDYPKKITDCFFVLINSVLLNLLCVWILRWLWTSVSWWAVCQLFSFPYYAWTAEAACSHFVQSSVYLCLASHHLPPALLAEWLCFFFTCYCSNMGVEQILK